MSLSRTPKTPGNSAVSQKLTQARGAEESNAKLSAGRLRRGVIPIQVLSWMAAQLQTLTDGPCLKKGLQNTSMQFPKIRGPNTDPG